MPKLNEPLSSSRLNMYLQCPLKFKFYYIDKIEPEYIASWQAFGSAFHLTLKHYYRKLQQQNEVLTLGQMQESFKVNWEISCTIPVQWNGDIPAELENKAYQMLQVYLENISPKKIIAVEQYFKIPVINPATGEMLRGAEFYGVIDLIEEDEVVEHKTSQRATWDVEKINQDTQMTLYSLAYFLIFKKLPKTCRFDIVTKGKSPKFQRIETSRDFSDFSRLFHTVKNVVRAIENDIFYPKYDWFCGDCYYKPKHCKEFGI